ncbi:MAG TPA: AAA family ATPase, partial [Thermoleophilia bacterium]|nr:AAA family ATPase [Thermoleophilia bacterium]
MYLRYLFIEGFKSFPEPSGLELQEGVCVLVGANGTGKSNLTDAVTWALGENDLGVLRCRSAEDLVFAGSEELLPMDSCEVTLVLDPRSERRKLEGLPPEVCKHGHAATHTRDLPEGALTITRRAERDGVTSFLVDGVASSEDEVRGRLADLGVGRPAVSAMRQGELDRLLLLDPGARRRLIEEAVGIPELSLRHARLCSERSAALMRRERLIGERMEAMERTAHLELEAQTLDRLRVLEAKQTALRAEAVRRALPPDSEARHRSAPTVTELLKLLGLLQGADAQLPDPAPDYARDPAPTTAPGGPRSGSVPGGSVPGGAESGSLPGDTESGSVPGGAEPTSWTGLRSELELCATRLAELGPVNTRAAEDLIAARTRVTEIDRLLAVGDADTRALEAHIDSLDAEMAALFAEGLERIEGRFRSHYE